MEEKTDINIKKKWECPVLSNLDAKKTESGTPDGTPEGLTYNPVISDNA